MLRQVLESISQRLHFLVTSHARPDGDAVGSVLAATQLLRSMGKQADAVLSGGVPVIYRPLPYSDLITHADSVNGQYDAALILECDSVLRTGITGIEAEGRLLINIDHHASAKPFADINWIEPAAAATAEMIFDLAKASGVAITPEMATCLYTAVLTDTGSFCYEGTGEKTFALAQELVRAGADPVTIARDIYFSNPESKFRLLGAALSSLRRVGDVMWTYVSQTQMQQCGASEEDCEGLVNYVIGIAGVEVAMLFRELPGGRYRLSLRSKGKVDVAAVAARFGGGGHRCAGGCSVEGPLSLAAERMIAEVGSRTR